MLIDLYRFLLEYLPVLLVGIPVMYWFYDRRRTDRQWRSVITVLVIAAAVLAAYFFASQFPVATRYTWSGGRLAPAIAWVKGYRLYYPADEGPVLVQMYGPVSAMVYAFTALAAGPTAAILMGAACNFAFYTLPAAWFLWRSRRTQSGLIIAAGLVLFLMISSRQLVLSNTATLVTIDAPAAGLAACAFAVLAGKHQNRSGWAGLICGLLAALSMWTKLTFAPVTIALALYALLLLEWRDAVRFIACMTIAVLGVSALFLIGFGRELWFQNVIVPVNQPWTRSHWSRRGAYLQGMYEMLGYAWPVQWLLLAGVLIAVCRLRRITGRRQWAGDNPWLLPAMAAVLVFPTATLAYVKIGGIWNNAAASAYFGLLAAASALSGACAPDGELDLGSRVRRLSRATLAIALLAGWWIPPTTWKQTWSNLSLWADLQNNDHQLAYEYTQRHPGEAYFPGYPLSTLLAEGRLYHFHAGIESLDWAGRRVSDEHYHAWLPPRMKVIVFFPQGPPPHIWPRLPEFQHEVRIPELSNWIALGRDDNQAQ